jgi:hypothetical protein
MNTSGREGDLGSLNVSAMRRQCLDWCASGLWAWAVEWFATHNVAKKM